MGPNKQINTGGHFVAEKMANAPVYLNIHRDAFCPYFLMYTIGRTLH